MGTSDTRLIDMVDETTRLAGSNRMELLLFSLGGSEAYGINVFKVREVCEAMTITRTPNAPDGVEGIISLRGSILPVINLARCLHLEPGAGDNKLIVTEFSSHAQAFLVASVDRIVRVEWEKIKTPQGMLAGASSRITALTELGGGKLVSILDVEQILADVMGEEHVPVLGQIPACDARMVFFADDSAIARRKIVEVLESLGLPHQHAVNGRDAWEKLQAMAELHARNGEVLSEHLGAILVDAEMPEMDGYVLTRNVKADRRFANITVVMHSSLSSIANRKLGEKVGVDAYVAKFHPEELVGALSAALARH